MERQQTHYFGDDCPGGHLDMPVAIKERMEGVLKSEAVAAWWMLPIPAWDGVTPREMWAEDPDRVRELVEGYYDPSYS